MHRIAKLTLFCFTTAALACQPTATESTTAVGSTAKQTTSESTTQTPPAESTQKVDVTADPKPGDEVAIVETNLGQIVLRFFPEKAPNHVKNFKDLAKKGFYDGTKFHRVIPGFMIQGGDPNSKDDDRSDDGTGGPGHTVNAEFNDIKHERGILSAARSMDPNSAGSQFFIMVATSPNLDNQYSAFGKVVKGMEVVDKIVNLPRDKSDNPFEKNPAIMKSVRITKWPIQEKSN